MTGSMMAPGMQELQPSFFADAAKLLTESLPQAQYRELAGETHQVNSGKLAAALDEFFNS